MLFYLFKLLNLHLEYGLDMYVAEWNQNKKRRSIADP